jgi:type I restriction enzyme M protein
MEKVVGTFLSWKNGEHSVTNDVILQYVDLPGLCKSATLDEIAKHDFVLTPGRYVGADEGEQDEAPFAETMQRLSKELAEQLEEGERLSSVIRQNLSELGYAQ